MLQVHDLKARNWYEKEAYEQTWSTKTLQRNINTQYYCRMLQSQNKNAVEIEMKEKTLNDQNDKLEFVKNPVIAEFMGLSANTDMTESDLETAILNNLQKFLMELGKGYAFVARQQHIHTEKEDYYIDLVFYNYILKCFVLIDLKTNKITYQDVGQMDMYVRMYDELKKGRMTIRQSVLYFVKKRMRTLRDTLFFMAMSSYLLPNINCIYRMRMN